MTLNEFDLEWEQFGVYGEFCPYDYLTIQNGEDTEKLCGYQPGKKLCFSGSNEIVFNFFADDYPDTADNYLGFEIDFDIYKTGKFLFIVYEILINFPS